jgi:hypothetical protein
MNITERIRAYVRECIEAAKDGWREVEELHTRRCSRCRKVVDREPFPRTGMTAGYYDVQGDPSYEWGCYARPGEKFLCDSCMWADPKYILRRGTAVLKTGWDNDQTR